MRTVATTLWARTLLHLAFAFCALSNVDWADSFAVAKCAYSSEFWGAFSSSHFEHVSDDLASIQSRAQSSNQAMVPSLTPNTSSLVVTNTTLKRVGDETTMKGEGSISKKAKQPENRQFIPRLCPKLMAKFSHLPSNGGCMKRDSDQITRFTSYPQASYDCPKAKRVATIATDLCASAHDKVYLDSEGAVIGRPPEVFPG